MNLNASTSAVGTLGPALFNLDLYESFVTVIIFNVLGTISVAGIACFGPASGLRTPVFLPIQLGLLRRSNCICSWHYFWTQLGSYK